MEYLFPSPNYRSLALFYLGVPILAQHLEMHVAFVVLGRDETPTIQVPHIILFRTPSSRAQVRAGPLNSGTSVAAG